MSSIIAEKFDFVEGKCYERKYRIRCRADPQYVGKRFVLLLTLFMVIAASEAFYTTDMKSIGTRGLADSSSIPSFQKHSMFRHHTTLKSSRLGDDLDDPKTRTSLDGSNVDDKMMNQSNEQEPSSPSFLESIMKGFYEGNMPPFQVEDVNILFYDVFLIVNLSLSISFWVTHRMSFEYLGSAFNEGCLLSLFWIASGLYHGSFLMSAVDGHYGSTDERGGPKAAAMLGFTTFVNAINLRLLFSLIVSIAQHRPVGSDPAEQLLPLEIAFGLVLMSIWRGLHSSYTPRI